MKVTKRAFIDRALDSLDSFFIEQQQRVARRLQQTEEEIERRSDGMDRRHALTETVVTSRG
jgi:hypothetical protein